MVTEHLEDKRFSDERETSCENRQETGVETWATISLCCTSFEKKAMPTMTLKRVSLGYSFSGKRKSGRNKNLVHAQDNDFSILFLR